MNYMKYIYALLLAWVFGAGATVELKDVYRLEIEVASELQDVLTLNEVKDAKGSVYFVSYRRGSQLMPSIVVSQKQFQNWRKAFQPYLTNSSTCLHPVRMVETLKQRTEFQFCPTSSSKIRKLANVSTPVQTANEIIAYYRKQTGWDK